MTSGGFLSGKIVGDGLILRHDASTEAITKPPQRQPGRWPGALRLFPPISVRWVLCTLAFFGIGSTVLGAQQAAIIAESLEARIAAAPEMAAAGAQGADVTIIEFFDYNCPYCKKTAPELQKLLAADRDVRVIYKEWPIFGDVSTYAARSALAANWQGKYLLAHNALIGTPADLDDMAQVDSVLKSAGLDLKRLNLDRTHHSADIDRILARNAAEARQLGLRGTPGFLINRQLLSRALTLTQLQQLVAGARSTH